MDERRSHVNRLKKRITGGDYAVDPHAVADAVLARLQAERSIEIERLGPGGQGETALKASARTRATPSRQSRRSVRPVFRPGPARSS